MDESEYHDKSILPLTRLLEFAEELEEKYELEAELEEGILYIIMPDKREYVINKHTPSRQIWVSSPYSGAGYFEFDGANWVPKRAAAAEGLKLEDFIMSEVKAHLVAKPS